MRSHPTDSELQLSACRTLAKLARHDGNLVKIAAAGGIQCIATAMA
jgi:dihydroorotate dehydrogenase